MPVAMPVMPSIWAEMGAVVSNTPGVQTSGEQTSGTVTEGVQVPGTQTAGMHVSGTHVWQQQPPNIQVWQQQPPQQHDFGVQTSGVQTPGMV